VDGVGGIQLKYDGSTEGAFSPVGSAPAAAHAGLEIQLNGVAYRLGDALTRTTIAAPRLLAGQSAGTQVLQTTYGIRAASTAPPFLNVREEIRYVAGESRVELSYVFSSGAGATGGLPAFNAGVLGDLYVNHSDDAAGLFLANGQGVPTLLGATNGGVSTAFTAASDYPWSAYQEGLASDVFAAFARGFTNRYEPASVNAGAGISWVVFIDNPITERVDLVVGRPDPVIVPPIIPPVIPPVILPPPPPPPPPPALLVPIPDKLFVARRISGRVLVKLPGTGRFVDLLTIAGFPLNTIVDTTRGRVQLTVAADREGGTQTADFYEGIFKVTQRGGATNRLVGWMKLVGELPTCRVVRQRGAVRARARGAARIAGKAKPPRRLWGDGHGRFSTQGKYSSATVRGTKWLVEDNCSGTLTRVARGFVYVDDFVKGRTTTVRAGRTYLARVRR
jgi:hypothetical protein